MEETIIKIENLSKKYKMYNKKRDVFAEALFPWLNRHRLFTAVDDVSLEIKRGESVGIMGSNGAGKSTILKMITGVVKPSSGTLETYGKISSLLELGTAFNPELTGLQNIYQHGQVFGLTNEQIKEREQEIIDFASIGDHLYQPVKTYSSGMFARLAFACAINVDPDILIVDEVLSVGDMAFQMKCFKKFEQFKDAGKTILFVSHNTNDILTNCDRAVILDKGKKIFDGTSKEGVERFKKLMSGVDLDENKGITGNSVMQINPEMLVYGNGKAAISNFVIKNEKDEVTSTVSNSEKITFSYDVTFNEFVENPIFTMSVKNFKGVVVCGANTNLYGVKTRNYNAGEVAHVKFVQRIPLAPDKYSLSISCTKYQDDGELEIIDRHYDAIFFDITSTRASVGILDVKSEIEIE
ncbi:MAG: ABC transporter ATP-binding protein [Ruminococcaceae bacterium]|nr:ABC transporter ATP-binding protein [Oscillospiraceae bacterium]